MVTNKSQAERGYNVVITEMSDRDAAQFLGVTYATIRNGVKRGALTRVQKAGITQRVAKEQVELFKGRRILLGELTQGELKKWQAINDTLTVQAPTPALPSQEKIQTPPANIMEDAKAMAVVLAEMFNLLRMGPLPPQFDGLQEIAQKKTELSPSDVEESFDELTRQFVSGIQTGKVNVERMKALTRDVQENGRDFNKMLELIELIVPIFEIYVNWLEAQNEVETKVS